MSPTPSSPTADRRFIFFGGKGGAGKTTCAAAAALALGGSVLALSLDPAHSLKDVLGAASVDVLELDARQEFAAFMAAHREQLRTVADRGTYFDDEDIQGFLDLALPGLDEIMALLKLGELARQEQPRRIVVDLPPTGHALRLFDVAAAFDHLVEALELMQGKHEFAVSSLTRRYVPDGIDTFLSELRSSCEAARTSLLPASTSAWVVVARPQPMVLSETVRLVRQLRASGAEPAALVLNMAQPEGAPLPPELTNLPVFCVPPLLAPPIGAAGLRPVVDALAPLLGVRRREPAKRAGQQSSAAAQPPRGSLAPLLREPRRLTIFGGKGGVGKTTLAAATALALARCDRTRSVVVMSIDPAHSLGDSLEQKLGNDCRQVAAEPNLQAVELDPQAHWREFKAHWQEEGEQLFAGLPGGGRLDPVYDRQIAAQLGNIQPTGLDELQAALSVIDLLDEDAARLVVVDSAPTGHLLRFLESPRLVTDWARELMRMLLKYDLASHAKHLSRDLLDLSRKTKRLEALLHDPLLCEVVVVTMAEAPVVAETERLIEALKQQRIQVRHVVVNQAMSGELDLGGLDGRNPELDFLRIGRREEPVQGLAALAELAA